MVLRLDGLSDGEVTLRQQFDLRGSLVRRVWQDAALQPADHPRLGYATLRVEVDLLGSPVWERWFAADGSPSTAVRGFASHRVLRDLHRNIIEESWLDADGEPTPNADGCARVERTFSGPERWVSEVCHP